MTDQQVDAPTGSLAAPPRMWDRLKRVLFGVGVAGLGLFLLVAGGDDRGPPLGKIPGGPDLEVAIRDVTHTLSPISSCLDSGDVKDCAHADGPVRRLVFPQGGPLEISTSKTDPTMEIQLCGNPSVPGMCEYKKVVGRDDFTFGVLTSSTTELSVTVEWGFGHARYQAQLLVE